MANPDYHLIGKSLPRIDSAPKVSGEALFTGDLNLPRMLVGKILRSPYTHALIKTIDISKAKALKGVHAVITGQDTAGEKWGVFKYTRDQQLLCVDKVRYVGDEVAAVAAVDEETADEALDLISVEYEELPGVFDCFSAIAPGAPVIHDSHPRNINVAVKIEVGDVEEAFKKCSIIREDTFAADEDSYFMMEPYAVVANYRSDGSIEIWMPNASPHTKAKALSNALRIPLTKVIARKITIGGAFGGRSDVFPAEFITCLLSIKSKRPVKVVYTREENSIATRMGHAMTTTIKTGVDKEGRVLARDIVSYLDGGAYSSTGPIATSVPFLCHEQTYRLENVRFHGYRIYTNKPVRGMIRIHGRSFACGIDTQLDMIAQELGIDPITIRLKNARRPGETTATGSYVSSCGLVECIEKTAAKSDFINKFNNKKPFHGIGIGINSVQTGFPLGIRGGSQALIKFHEDGGATVISGVVDNGQGNDNMLVQIAAEELGIPVEEIRLISADTEITPTDAGSYSMISTFGGGNAVKRAAADARRQIFEIASELLEADPEDLVAKDKKIFVRGAPHAGIPMEKIIRKSLLIGRPIMGTGSFSPEVDQRREWVSNPRGQLSQAFSFGATVAEVEVDPETGTVKAHNVTCAQDCGFALNPMVVEGQFQGGVAMGGQGGMLTEAHHWSQGHVLNPTMLEYKIPIIKDMPNIETIIVESIDPVGPYGAKEAGMSIAMSAAQAYANAIGNALGIYFNRFPLTPERIFDAIENRKSGIETAWDLEPARVIEFDK
ncbi:MAG: xanthine dehydrogenase family protein molybdopterin-binding subunit [Deltaproteobacteria bacterium]|nr:xanthine dehydrogenase family protein molybdopterin-binding subunit [Deltaproteobacteria bacterium]